MQSNNVVVLRGVVSVEPRRRQLPSGTFVTQFDVTTDSAGQRASVPVSVSERDVDAVAGDQVVVTGYVNRRFFRAGGHTQSRTEVVADSVVRVSRKRAVERAIASAVDILLAH